MNFIEVAEGLKEKRAFKRKHWAETQYLIQDRYKNIRLFDYNDVERYEVSVADILATDWEECEKNTWLIISDYQHYGLANDEVYTYYTLTKKETDEWDNYPNNQIHESDLKDWTYYINIEFDSNNDYFSETEKEKIRKLF